MDWSSIRDHYATRLDEAKRAGETQESVAEAGGLSGQNAISKLLRNQNMGPSVETFIKAVLGLGMPVSAFFAEVERATSQPELRPLTRDGHRPSRATRNLSSLAAGSATKPPTDPAHGRPDGVSTVAEKSRRRDRRATLDREQVKAIVAAHFEVLARQITHFYTSLAQTESAPGVDPSVAPRPGADRVHGASATADRRDSRRGRRKSA